MEIATWSLANNALSFTVSTNLDTYPTCKLNGEESQSLTGLYRFKIQPRKQYNLVCTSSYDTKVYKIKRSFVASRAIPFFPLILLLAFVLGVLFVVVYFPDVVAAGQSPLSFSFMRRQLKAFLVNAFLPAEEDGGNDGRRLLRYSIQSSEPETSPIVIPSEWRCPSCLYNNRIEDTQCAMCHHMNPDIALMSEVQSEVNDADAEKKSNSVQNDTEVTSNSVQKEKSVSTQKERKNSITTKKERKNSIPAQKERKNSIPAQNEKKNSILTQKEKNNSIPTQKEEDPTPIEITPQPDSIQNP